MNTSKTIIALVVLIIIAAAFGFIVEKESPLSQKGGKTLIATVSYSCDAGKAIAASLYDGPSQPPKGEGQPPVPGGSAHVTLSDGRTLDLMQTISADGVRYANADESFVFWTKGNGAFVMEGNAQTYQNCVEAAN